MTSPRSLRSFAHLTPRSAVTLMLGVLAACSGSSGGTTTGQVSTGGGSFLVVRTDPVNNGRIYLNDPVRVDFSRNVDIDSANLNTVTFTVLDALGQPTSDLVSGNFTLDKSPGDDLPGRRMLFTPHFATNNAYDDGGFRAGRTYLVQLVGGSSLNGTALRDVSGKVLQAPVTFTFTTVEGTSPSQLYRNPIAGGPRRITQNGLTISNTADLANVPLNQFGSAPVEVRLHFDQALNPNDGNVPVNFDPNPATRQQSNRGRIYLEYDDPIYGANTWIPAEVSIEDNGLTGSTVAVRPVGVLPNNADIRVIVDATLEDISGESNVGNLSYNPVFGTFHTQAAYDQQFNCIAERFLTADNIDFSSPFPEPLADVGPGYVKASFQFEGSNTSLEYEPTVAEVVLNTSFTQIVPKTGLPFNVSGGVFNFRNVHIPQGVRVQGQGPNPMVWLVSGDFVVDGTLSVDGGRGARVDTLNSANFAKAGGIGSCGGGNGGAGTPSGVSRDLRGGTGNGPMQVPGKGGGGGRIACTAGCYTGSGYGGNGGGSGGGGGTLSTQGDPRYDTATYTGVTFQQKRGIGGNGCTGAAGAANRTLLGGEAAPQVFTDSRIDNNFWGVAIDPRPSHNLRIAGEMAVPVGGGGGGGGGDTSYNFSCSATDPSFINDYSGGGGGGGAGVLIVKALGTIEIRPTGQITANGGHGGGGEQVGSCGEAGGGGAGSGGMVILMSATKIRLHGHSTGNRYLFAGDPANANNNNVNKDYNFAISADGGVCTTGTFGSPVVQGKYPAAGQAVMAGSTYDGNPLGALGGMGIVQLMTPPGDTDADGTGTIFDENIEIVLPLSPPAGVTKRTILGWRGHPDSTGLFYNDLGVQIPSVGASAFGEGDIRPAPTLLPVPFNSRSRVRSKWLDTGFSRRRELASSDDQPRGIVGASAGPDYEFAGLDQATTVGYADYEVVGSTGVKIVYPVRVNPVDIATTGAINTGATYLGEPAYQIKLSTASLGTEIDRYAGFEAEFLNLNGTVIGGARILAHTEDTLVLAPDGKLLPNNIAKVQVRAKFFKVVTNGSEGLGPVYLSGGTPVPNGNVRIGFAFHQNPSLASGRYPSNPNQFVHDMNDAGLQAWIAANGKPGFVMYDVTFDMAYERNGSVPPSLSPSSPRPGLEYLRIPFRF